MAMIQESISQLAKEYSKNPTKYNSRPKSPGGNMNLYDDKEILLSKMDA